MLEYSFDLDVFESFLLILVRISSFFFTAPIFGASEVAPRIKVGVAFFISLIVSFATDMEGVAYAGVLDYAFIVLKEVLVGALIGFAAYICESIILYAGTIIDMDIGLSMAQVFDPSVGTTVAITGNLYRYTLILFFVTSNMYHFTLRAAIDSFKVIPLGGINYQSDTMLQVIIGFITDLFIIAFRIILPIFASIMIMNVVLGVMAKVAPQMNMFAVGVQLKLLAGFAILFITTFLLGDIANFVFNETRNIITQVIEAMSP